MPTFVILDNGEPVCWYDCEDNQTPQYPAHLAPNGQFIHERRDRPLLNRVQILESRIPKDCSEDINKLAKQLEKEIEDVNTIKERLEKALNEIGVLRRLLGF